MTKKIVILTGSELRHQYFRKYLALTENIEVVNSYCEGLEKSLRTITEQKCHPEDLRLNHLTNREQAEIDAFGVFIETTNDYSNPVFLPKGDINSSEYVQLIIDSKPDLVIAYGCSIIKEPLLNAFEGKFLNVHLGLSPYYRGSGTNYWPLVNGEPEFVGATFMYIDSGVDTGEIIHQIRAKYCWGDTPSQVGNRLIIQMSRIYREIIINFERLINMPQLPNPKNEKVYKKKDFSEESVVKLYKNFRNDLLANYLAEESSRCARFPIIENPILSIDQ